MQKAITVQHVTIVSSRTFEEVKAALEAKVPRLDPMVLDLVHHGKAEEALLRLQQGPALSIFGSRNHGEVLRIAGQSRKAIQYDIGNPLTASKMTRHHLSAALYPPIRVLLREGPDGSVAFEYDSPASVVAQFDDAQVNLVAKDLDEQLRLVLQASATPKHELAEDF